MGRAFDHLCRLYADTSDPWSFETSAYEQAKFAATRQALLRPRYRSAFELGCGNGQLARHLIAACDTYTGMDAIGAALAAARLAVPSARLVQGFYPCPLPDGAFDLLVLSEILYFLDPESLGQLAADIGTRWPRAEILCVTWCGDTGNPLQGAEALAVFRAALGTHVLRPVVENEGYRIDRGLPRRQR